MKADTTVEDLRVKAEELAARGDVMSRELLAAWAKVKRLKDELQGEIRAHAAHHENENAEVARLTAEVKRYKDGFEGVSQRYEDLLVQLSGQN